MTVIAIFGAAGATGQHAVRQARARGHEVIAIEHSWPADAADDAGVTHRKADVLSDDLRPVLEGAEAVLSCLGVGNDPATLLDPPPLYTKGTRAIVDAMTDNGLNRLIVISASFVEAQDRGPVWFRLPAMPALHNVFAQMEEMEEMLHKTDLAWTAVRPGWLMEGDLTADYVVQADVIPAELVRSRHADVAHLMLDILDDNTWVRQTPAMARAESPAATSPAAVAREMLG